MKRLIFIAAVALVFGLLASGFLLFYLHGELLFVAGQSTPGALEPKGGKRMFLEPDPDGTFYSQRDKRWADDPLGGTSESLRNTGCLLCCVAMGLNDLGVIYDPPALNRFLNERQGYTDRGWIVWDAVNQAASGKGRVHFVTQIDYDVIDDALSAGDFPIVKVFLPGGAPHWVLVVGKRGNEYLVKDPLRAEGDPIPLSQFRSQIHAVRVIERTESA